MTQKVYKKIQRKFQFISSVFQNGFAIVLPGKREEHFYVESSNERKSWLDAFLDQMHQLNKSRKSLRQEIVVPEGKILAGK